MILKKLEKNEIKRDFLREFDDFKKTTQDNLYELTKGQRISFSIQNGILNVYLNEVYVGKITLEGVV